MLGWSIVCTRTIVVDTFISLPENFFFNKVPLNVFNFHENHNFMLPVYRYSMGGRDVYVHMYMYM